MIHKPVTRPEAQERLDDLYRRGEITHQEWSARTDLIGSVGFRAYEAALAGLGDKIKK